MTECAYFLTIQLHYSVIAAQFGGQVQSKTAASNTSLRATKQAWTMGLWDNRGLFKRKYGLLE
jgi:hypothetical protein